MGQESTGGIWLGPATAGEIPTSPSLHQRWLGAIRKNTHPDGEAYVNLEHPGEEYDAWGGPLLAGTTQGYGEDTSPWVKAKAVASARLRDLVLL